MAEVKKGNLDSCAELKLRTERGNLESIAVSLRNVILDSLAKVKRGILDFLADRRYYLDSLAEAKRSHYGFLVEC